MANETGVTISFNEYKALVEFKINRLEEKAAVMDDIAGDRLDTITELRLKCRELENQVKFLEAKLKNESEAENG